MRARWFTLTLIALSMGWVAACSLPAAAEPLPTPFIDLTVPAATASRAPVTGLASLLDSLAATGVRVELLGEVEQPIFALPGQRLSVGGAAVQVYEFDDDAGAAAAAALVAPDGRAVDAASVRWPASPHFYRAGQLIALYLGDDLAILNLLGAALGAQFAGGPAGAAPTSLPAADRLSLVDELRTAGARVGAVGEVTQPFFSVTGQIIAIDGREVQVFEYASAEAAQVEAALVAPDGYAIGSYHVSWSAAPHFFQAGRVIVLYLGDDAATLAQLDAVLGPQVAGLTSAAG